MGCLGLLKESMIAMWAMGCEFGVRVGNFCRFGFAFEGLGIGGLSALMGRTFMSAMRRRKKVSRTVAGRAGY